MILSSRRSRVAVEPSNDAPYDDEQNNHDSEDAGGFEEESNGADNDDEFVGEHSSRQEGVNDS